MAATDDSATPPITILLRRNSTVTPPVLAARPATFPPSSLCSSSSVDFEQISIKPTCYTSLRDILPSPETVLQSPKNPYYAANSGYEILIRNRLVKQAAWAYLQPMSTSPETDGSTTFHRLWTQFSGTLIRFITTALDFLLRSIQIGTTASELYHLKR